MRLRIAVVGVGSEPGSRARSYLATIAKLSAEFELCAVCDVNPSDARAVAETYDATPFTDPVTMLREARPDLVFALVPTDAQPVIAMTVAEAGVHLMTEIPRGLTRPIGDAIAAACRRNGVLWEVAEQVWLWPEEQLKQRVVRSGRLGEIVHARLAYGSGAYHGFNAIRMLLGAEPVRVLGCVREVASPPYTAYGGESMTSRIWEQAAIEFEGGAICLYEKPLRPTGNRWEIHGTKGRIVGREVRIEGHGGETTHPIEERYVERDGERLLAELRVELDPPIVWENPFLDVGIGDPDDIAKAALLTGMHRAIAEGAEPRYGEANARRDLEIWFAVWESDRRGNVWVDLPLPEGPTPLERRIRELYRRRYGGDPVEETAALLKTRFSRSSVLWEAAQWL